MAARPRLSDLFWLAVAQEAAQIREREQIIRERYEFVNDVIRECNTICEELAKVRKSLEYSYREASHSVSRAYDAQRTMRDSTRNLVRELRTIGRVQEDTQLHLEQATFALHVARKALYGDNTAQPPHDTLP
jgi:chromosome segregation ATPase